MANICADRAGAAKQAIAIFAKPPIPGHTKSRLASRTNPQFAADLSAAMLSDLLHDASTVDAETILFHPPNYRPKDFSSIQGLPDRSMAQEGHGLGERMSNCFRRLLEVDGFSRVIIIGSDCIAHTRESLTDAFSHLRAHQVVIQPADDGGYVLIGATQAIPRVFENIDWGTDRVWEQTLSRLDDSLNVKLLPPSFDVDTVDDLYRLREYCLTNLRVNTQAVLVRDNADAGDRIW